VRVISKALYIALSHGCVHDHVSMDLKQLTHSETHACT